KRPQASWYYNCVAAIDPGLTPAELKSDLLSKIENKLGRQRTKDTFADRTIDLDVLLYDPPEPENSTVALPDPDIFVRPYLAAALLELSPGLLVPGPNGGLAAAAGKASSPPAEALQDYTRFLRNQIFPEG
ncbi:MAG: 2-amino-4-hydroxy-6-hydroxymethyldihydropteridine diphosphokinase, partial [Chitinivibrionales bacterium]|nr:2-amino-4-hydroxy-6-hydroxymethyldihydropteridine diphosphokinase [Chitinivibrionales bacterium]